MERHEGGRLGSWSECVWLGFKHSRPSRSSYTTGGISRVNGEWRGMWEAGWGSGSVFS